MARSKQPPTDPSTVVRRFGERSPRRPLGLLLDLGNTVLREAQYDFPCALSRIYELCDNATGYAEFAEHFSSLYRDLRSHLVSSVVEMSFQSFLRLALERLRSRPRVHLADLEFEFWKTGCEMTPAPGVADFLESASSFAMPMGIVSNAMFSSGLLTWKLESHRLLTPFQFLMSSAEYGLRKPHPAIFQAAAAKLGVDPRDIWFIGDSLHNDVAGANAAGMTSVWLNDRAGTESHNATFGARTWTEVLEALSAAVADDRPTAVD